MMFNLRTLLAIAAVMAVAGSAAAQNFSYSFQGLSGSQITSPITIEPANATFTDLIRGAGTVLPDGNNSNTFTLAGYTDKPANSTDASNLALALANGDYLSFTVTPDAGFTFTLESFAIRAKVLGQGPDRFVVRTSLDNFTGTTSGVLTGTEVGKGEVVGPTTPLGQRVLTANASTVTLPVAGVTNQTGSVEFRIYAYGATQQNPSSKFVLDETFGGTATFQPVPAPPAAVSLGIGGLVGLTGTGVGKMRRRASKQK